MLFEQISQLGGSCKFLQHVGTQLNAMKSQCSNVLNCLPVVSVPGDGSISEMNLAGRWRNRRVEVRQVHGRIKQLWPTEVLQRKGKRSASDCRRSYPAKKFKTGNTMVHNGVS